MEIFVFENKFIVGESARNNLIKLKNAHYYI